MSAVSTPGPWTQGVHEHMGIVVTGPGDYGTLAVPFGENAEANAAMIAAAPDLFEVLELCILHATMPADLRGKAHGAYAKARGQQ